MQPLLPERRLYDCRITSALSAVIDGDRIRVVAAELGDLERGSSRPRWRCRQKDRRHGKHDKTEPGCQGSTTGCPTRTGNNHTRSEATKPRIGRLSHM